MGWTMICGSRLSYRWPRRLRDRPRSLRLRLRGRRQMVTLPSDLVQHTFLPFRLRITPFGEHVLNSRPSERCTLSRAVSSAAIGQSVAALDVQDRLMRFAETRLGFGTMISALGERSPEREACSRGGVESRPGSLVPCHSPGLWHDWARIHVDLSQSHQSIRDQCPIRGRISSTLHKECSLKPGARTPEP